MSPRWPNHPYDPARRGNCGTNPSDFLDGVVGLVHRAQQPVGHRTQAGTLLLEEHGQVVDRCHILLGWSVIPIDEGAVADVPAIP
jgi:hypothetical protein